MGSGETGLGQRDALEVREHIGGNHPLDWAAGYNRISLVPCPQGGCQEMRRRMNGQRWQRTNQALTAWDTSDLGGTATSQVKGGPRQTIGALEALDY